MTHEFKHLIDTYLEAKKQGVKAVLATVVNLDGSSYRKPGVRMLILEDGRMIGAVSGGCVEKDIQRQSESIFRDGLAKMMTYDGRYRLGCEGILYILLELFQPQDEAVQAFRACIQQRDYFKIISAFRREEGVFPEIGSILDVGIQYPVSGASIKPKAQHTFEQLMPPCFKLMIFGAEHDAVQLCRYAALTGWEVTVVSGPLESKTISNFPGATAFYSVSPDALELSSIDHETAVVLMSHNYANDLKYLLELKDSKPAYLGLLGPAKRREKLLAQFLEYCPEADPDFIESVHGPAGLNIGAETPQEIAISILSEILTVIRKQTPMPLKEKTGGIHA